TLVAPSLAWYGEDTTVNLSYEHREFTTPFDRGTAIDPRTNRPLDIPRSRRLSGTLQLAGMQHDLQFGMDHEKRKIFRADLLRDSKTSRFDYLDPVYGQVV
ncbi:hypothetical protein D6C61_25930, partial [Escherichia coli]